ncbi:MAG TPA: M56 family metallopeptidase [Bryobacteraceae bacterium]|jgi:uncharacterized protein (TIGR03435 family)|nr:M56 family metallopeptidase [Bryobacteraceae bacterium]
MIDELTNHIWQSTIFVILAGLMAFAFRKNKAKVRYWFWLSASLKFLLPFSLLMSLGSRLQWVPGSQKIAAAPVVASTVLQMSQPFPGTSFVAPPNQQRTRNEAAIGIFGVWLCGFLVIVVLRGRSWRRIRAVVHSSRRIDISAITPIETRSSPGLLEPGVVGVFHPILLLPAGIVERLNPRQLEAVLAHELCHIRRRDNLTATIHMMVEAVFWFYPVVWWVGARLLEERERACDEEVLRLGNSRHDYAEGILKVCKNYLESPLSCVSGVTGSNLKKRVQAILTGDAPGGLTFAKKLALTLAGISAVGAPIAAGIISAGHVRAQPRPDLAQSAGVAMPKFEVASIKRDPFVWSDPARHPMGVRMEPGGRLRAQNAPVMLLIERAYGVQAFQVVGGPPWINREGYDIEAKPENIADLKQARLMLQTLLADRFKLVLHRELRELPVYDLEVVKGGPKLPAAAAESCVSRPPGAPPTPARPGQTNCGYVAGPLGSTALLQLEGSKVHMADFISKLELILGRPVLDKTDITRYFSVKLRFSAGEATIGLPGYGGPGDPGGTRHPEDPDQPNIFSALKEQLGLRLVSAKGPVEVLVIDHVERPTAN